MNLKKSGLIDNLKKSGLIDKLKKFGLIDVTGAALFAFILLAFACCFFLGNSRGGVYQETLQARGLWLMAGGAVFVVAFFAVWLIRRRAISRHLLETYGEECFKTFREQRISPNYKEPEASYEKQGNARKKANGKVRKA